jgi:hypothetical protein
MRVISALLAGAVQKALSPASRLEIPPPILEKK